MTVNGLIELGELLVIAGLVVLAAYFQLRTARKVYDAALAINRAATAQRDANKAMIATLSDQIEQFGLLVKEMRREHDAERGKVYGAAPVPTNMPRLSDPEAFHTHVSEVASLAEALHSNKLTLPALVEECYVCNCSITGWSGPHCHYHHASVPEGYEHCVYLGVQ